MYICRLYFEHLTYEMHSNVVQIAKASNNDLPISMHVQICLNSYVCGGEVEG